MYSISKEGVEKNSIRIMFIQLMVNSIAEGVFIVFKIKVSQNVSIIRKIEFWSLKNPKDTV